MRHPGDKLFACAVEVICGNIHQCESLRCPSGGYELLKTALDGADLAGAYLEGAQFLNRAQLIIARNWQSAFRNETLACGAVIPDRYPSA